MPILNQNRLVNWKASSYHMPQKQNANKETKILFHNFEVFVCVNNLRISKTFIFSYQIVTPEICNCVGKPREKMYYFSTTQVLCRCDSNQSNQSADDLKNQSCRITASNNSSTSETNYYEHVNKYYIFFLLVCVLCLS